MPPLPAHGRFRVVADGSRAVTASDADRAVRAVVQEKGSPSAPELIREALARLKERFGGVHPGRHRDAARAVPPRAAHAHRCRRRRVAILAPRVDRPAEAHRTLCSFLDPSSPLTRSSVQPWLVSS